MVPTRNRLRCDIAPPTKAQALRQAAVAKHTGRSISYLPGLCQYTPAEVSRIARPSASSDSASKVVWSWQATVSKGIGRGRAIRAVSDGYLGGLSAVVEGGTKTRIAAVSTRREQ